MLPPLIVLRHPVAAAAAATGIVAALGATAYAIFRRRPSPEEIESLRRDHLAQIGRIVDGTLVDAAPSFDQPTVIFYRYRIAGVIYECSQSISVFAHQIHDLDIDLPIQVRYDRANPGDSIVIAEQWSGLWSMDPVKPVVRQ